MIISKWPVVLALLTSALRQDGLRYLWIDEELSPMDKINEAHAFVEHDYDVMLITTAAVKEG